MKTPDYVKRSLVACTELNLPQEAQNRAMLDALALIQQLEAQIPRWVSVEEKLPEVEKRYDGYEFSEELLVYDGLRRRTAYYCHTSGVWYDSWYEDDTFDVTHWMPLPEPPKEDE